MTMKIAPEYSIALFADVPTMMDRDFRIWWLGRRAGHRFPQLQWPCGLSRWQTANLDVAVFVLEMAPGRPGEPEAPLIVDGGAHSLAVSPAAGRETGRVAPFLSVEPDRLDLPYAAARRMSQVACLKIDFA
jgi:hypothetical protein